LAHRPEPSAPRFQQAVALDAQHASLVLVGAAGRQAGGGAEGLMCEILSRSAVLNSNEVESSSVASVGRLKLLGH
jgi:hypothetical protein